MLFKFCNFEMHYTNNFSLLYLCISGMFTLSSSYAGPVEQKWRDTVVKRFGRLGYGVKGCRFESLIGLTGDGNSACQPSSKCVSCTPDKDIRVFYLDRQFFSCTPDKDIRVFHLSLQILSHPCYLTQGRIKITCI